jgi:hypothetical protein
MGNTRVERRSNKIFIVISSMSVGWTIISGGCMFIASRLQSRMCSIMSILRELGPRVGCKADLFATHELLNSTRQFGFDGIVT